MSFNNSFSSRNTFLKRRKSASKSTATRRLLLESLEHRVVMTGTWQTLTPVNPTAGPPGTQAIMQLSDGTIMVQGGNNAPTRTWFKLTPDATGDYLKGTWSSMPNMNVGRLFFTTAMLPSAKVFAVGGEYDDTGNAGGFTNTAEIYDPVTNAWNAIPPAPTPTSRFGDDPISVLPDGQVLAGYFASGLTYRYNPITNSWSTTAGSKVRNDASDEETWVKLPDDSILSYDVFSSLTSSPINTFKAQRYIPSADRWVDASNLDPANPPSILSTPNEGYELGPAFLLPDSNRVIYFGTNGNTAIYDIARNLWSAGPSEPTKVIGGTVTKLVGTDNPGAMLPNGKILITFSPQGSSAGGGYNFPSPTYVYEYDPEAQTYVEVTPSSGLGGNSFLYNMLVLPTGQIMLCDQTSRTVRVYTPDGSPQDAWRPTIEQITDDGNGTYTLTGTQLNGRGEGATYGDDWQSATNYPLVKIVDTAGNTRYARTFDWTNTGVATGSTPVSTKFTLPTGLQLNQVATFTVIANGIASNPTNLIEIHLDSGDALYTENAPPVLVSPGATIVDRFNTDLNGLKLIATIGLNSEPTDQLTIVPTGNGAGQISTTPTRIRFGGVDIGSWTKSGFQITVTFNSAASTVAAQAIIRQFAYSSTSESPGLVPRRFDVSMGGLIQSRLIRIKTLNDSPSLVDVTLPVIDEDSVQPVGRAINVLFANSFSDPDAGAQLSGIAIVSNTATGSQGTWYYSGDGGTWLPIGSVDDASKSLLLSPSSWLGFKPSPDFFGSPNPLLARSLDETFKGTFTVPGGTPIYLDPTVKVTDGPVSTNTGKVQVRVRNINDPPTATLPSVLITATQDQPVNWAFPSDLFVDIDSATLTWSILPSGVPTIASWIDFDPVNHTLKGTPHNADVGDFEFQLRATDSSDASVSIPLKISIANINDPPEQLNLRGQQVSENDPGAKVGSLTVFDPDGKDTIAYSVSDSRFTIRDGILYLQATSSVDFETEPQISITVTATDNGTPSRSTSEKFEIHVQDVNEFFPDLNPTKYVIPFSRTDNLLLGTVTAADGDIFQTVKFRIQEDDAGIFEVGETSGQVRLKPGAIVTDPSYRVFISAYDDGSPSNSRVVLFNVDVEVPNRFAPQVLPGQRFSVAENS